MGQFNLLLLIIALGAIVFFIYKKIKSLKSFANKKMQDFEVLEVQISKSTEITESQFATMGAENMYSALHGLLKEDPSIQEHISFELVSSGSNGIRFYVVVPSNTLRFVESQIYAQYPNCQIKVVEDYTPSIDSRHSNFEFSEVVLSKKNFFPIKGYKEMDTDPISSFTSAIASLQADEQIWYQFLIRPIADNWQKEGYDYVEAVRDGADPSEKISFRKSFVKIVSLELMEMAGNIASGLFKKPDPDEKKAVVNKEEKKRIGFAAENELRYIEEKLSKMGFEVVMRIVSSGSDASRISANMRSAVASLKQFTTTSCNRFVSKLNGDKEIAIKDYKNRVFAEKDSFILNTEELATVYHFPTSNVETPNISWVYSKKSEPPSDLPTEDCCYIGETLFRNKPIKFGLANNDDRLRHLYVIGKSGTGKSTLFEQMVSQDIANGFGVGVLDPHGETIERVLQRIPDNRIDDVVYFDPSDTERPIGLNLLETDDPSQKNLMASGLVSALKQHFGFSWGPRLEYLLNYAILTLLELPGTHMLGITRLLEDQNYLNYILHQVKDPVVLKFWEQEYKPMKGNSRFVTEAISPIQNKVNRFLASTTIRNILGQKKSTLDIWDAMNSGKIILMNLSKGKIGADNANLLGALIVSRLQFYALQRVKIPYEDRRPFYLYVDEFQNFATGSFESILSESRKYKLGLYLTHQFTAQLPEELLQAVYGNVGTILAFALGAPDAREFAKEFAPYFNEEDFISQERFQVYMKLMRDGMTSHPFSARILVPWEERGALVPKTSNMEEVLRRSREKYGVPREYVEEKIAKWINTRFDKGLAIAQENKRKQRAQEQRNSM